MKIVRLKRGYRINCSDAEFVTLRMLVQQGVGECCAPGAGELYEAWPLVESHPKFVGGPHAMKVDEDRRR